MTDPAHVPQNSGILLFLRALLPSAIGMAWYFIGAFLIVGIHLLQVSLHGKAFPMNLDDYLLQGYTNLVVQPLATVVNSNMFNSAVGILLWGVAGWSVFALLSLVINGIANWRNTESDITMRHYGLVDHHPLRRTLFLRTAWRFCLAVVALCLTISLLPVIEYCLANGYRILAETSLPDVLRLLGVTVVCLMAIFHIYVVLLRLYLFRTRVFGEILY